MYKKLIFCFGLFGICNIANAVVLSRIDVTGNQRMDAESVRILSDVKVGDNVNSEKINNVTKKLQEC